VQEFGDTTFCACFVWYILGIHLLNFENRIKIKYQQITENR